jgi:hypothetical protein
MQVSALPGNGVVREQRLPLRGDAGIRISAEYGETHVGDRPHRPSAAFATVRCHGARGEANRVG